MARISRIVIPDNPHHIIQRGNRRQKVFFGDHDRRTYLDYLRLYAKPEGIDLWGYCLMDNHVHLIAVPRQEDSLARGLGETHRRYTTHINTREDWRGFLWEGRFKSYPLDESHLYAAIRYIERNPVRAGIVNCAWDYPWSSARTHINKEPNPVLSDNFLLNEIKDWKEFLSDEDDKVVLNNIRNHTNTGRPLGSDQFIERLEKITGRKLRVQKPGPRVMFDNN